MRDQTPGGNEWDSNPTIVHKDTRVWHGALRKGPTGVLWSILTWIRIYHRTWEWLRVWSFKHRTPQCAAILGAKPNKTKTQTFKGLHNSGRIDMIIPALLNRIAGSPVWNVGNPR